MLLSPTLFIAFLGGIMPALLWLSFWLLEDRCEPEPKRYIFYSFIAGMAAIVPVLFIEDFTASLLTGTALLAAWALTEEVAKFCAAYFTALRTWVFDEPLDGIIYMVTAALGFSGTENFLFLYGAINQGGAFHAILVGDLRFVGATLLHTLASATVGVALALSFHKSRVVRAAYLIGGVILAATLHTLFNFFILGEGGDATFSIFLCIWFGIVALLLLVERVKNPVRDYC